MQPEDVIKIEEPVLLPEQRDVDAAYRMAMADFIDAKRTKAEYGQFSPEFKAAWAAYESSWAHFLTTKKRFYWGDTEAQ